MSSNSSSPSNPSGSSSSSAKAHSNWSRAITLPAWVLLSFVVASLLTIGVLWVGNALGIVIPITSAAVSNTILTAVVYALTLLIVIGAPWLVRKIRTTKAELGLTRWPSWMDILLAPAGFLVYIVLSWLFGNVADAIIPWYDATEVQDTGFSGLTQNYQYLLAFVSLVVLAPVAEELLFRGYLFGKLKKHVPAWIAVVVASIAFGVAHASWTVGVDVFALGLVLCTLRLVSGSIWSSVLLHGLKNGIAFYLVFINPFFG